jgi:uncharacterized protein DUF6573
VDGPFDCAEIVDAYTRADALEDGFLVDITEAAREVGFALPVAMTRPAYEDCVAWTAADADRTGNRLQDARGRLHDVVWMALLAARGNRNADELTYQLLRVPRDRHRAPPELIALKLHVGPGDDGEPVFTISETQARRDDRPTRRRR